MDVVFLRPLGLRLHSRNLDKYGDYAAPRSKYNYDSYKNGANGTFVFTKGTIPEQFVPNMNRVLDKATSKGAVCLFSFPPYNKNACDSTTLNDTGFSDYCRDMDEVVHAHRISDVRDFIFEGKYFYNTDYHLNDEGAEIHTHKVVEDLLSYGIG